MQDASATPQAATDTVVVHRPDPGLGRGLWEAPPWLFLAALAAAVVLLGAYLGRRWRKSKR